MLLLVNPFLHLFGKTGSSSAHLKQVLAGNFQSPAVCNPFASLLLHHLYCPAQVVDLPPCSLKAYAASWYKAQESTSSTPSGIHFGHYIAGTFNPYILLLNATMADIPLHTGYSPIRWRKGLNVMLEKSPENFNVEKLCIILLFKANFNSNNK